MWSSLQPYLRVGAQRQGSWVSGGAYLCTERDDDERKDVERRVARRLARWELNDRLALKASKMDEVWRSLHTVAADVAQAAVSAQGAAAAAGVAARAWRLGEERRALLLVLFRSVSPRQWRGGLCVMRVCVMCDLLYTDCRHLVVGVLCAPFSQNHTPVPLVASPWGHLDLICCLCSLC